MKKQEKSKPILEHLSNRDKELFLADLLHAIETSKETGSFDAIDECLDSWETTAELNSIPGLNSKVWERFNKLKNAGVIHG